MTDPPRIPGPDSRRDIVTEETTEGGRMLEIRRDSRSDGGVVVALQGQVDLATAPQLTQAVANATKQGGDAVVVDLTDVDFLDSAGVRALVESAQAAATAGVAVTVTGASGWVARVLEITGVAEFLRGTQT
jgi:anti-sigma B factor antagonist